MINFKEDSTIIDRNFGLRVTETEAALLKKAKKILPQGNHHLWGEALHDGNQTWVGLHPETIQTPYSELKEICDLLEPEAGETVVDLGAGYGRLGLTLRGLYPESYFLGIEYVPERVEEGARVLQKGEDPRHSLLAGDLTDPEFSIPKGEYYFIYDFGKVPHIRSILNQFSTLADERRFTLVARGQGIRSLIEMEFSWLIETERRKNYSIYQG